MNTTTDYQKQAQDFLDKTGAKLSVRFLKYGKHSDDDQQSRDIYSCTIKRGKKSYKFNFGQSINASKKGEKPTAYDILSCLQKYDVGSFENFCGEFGYDTDSRKAEKTYKTVDKEYKSLAKLFSEEELSEMAEIQ